MTWKMLRVIISSTIEAIELSLDGMKLPGKVLCWCFVHVAIPYDAKLEY